MQLWGEAVATLAPYGTSRASILATVSGCIVVARGARMADEANKNSKSFDPMEPWRGMRDAYLDTWSKSMVEMVNTEAYAQATGAMLDTYLTVSTPFREAVEKAMLKTLEQLAMPSRADIVSIAERMTHIEMRLDDIDAKLDEMHKVITKPGARSVAASAPPAAKKTPRQTKKAGQSKRVKKGKK